jgi:hypothetical protein
MKKEGKKKYRRLRNELERATEKAKKEYIESVCDKTTGFRRTGCYYLMHVKTKVIGLERKPWKSKHWHQRLSGEYTRKSSSETSIENLGEVCYRAVQLAFST